MEIFESLIASMADIAANVPSTWRESNEQELARAQLDLLRNDARQQEIELQDTISFHKQYHEAVARAGDTLKEIEDELHDKASEDIELQNGAQFEASVEIFSVSGQDAFVHGDDIFCFILACALTFCLLSSL